MYRPPIWYLSNVELFRDLPEEDLARMMPVITEKVYTKGERIFDSADGCARTYIVQEGDVTVWLSAHGTATIIDILQPGALFGDMGYTWMPDGRCFAQASSKTYLCSLPSETFLAILRSHPSIALAALRQMQRKLAQYESRIHSLTSDNAHNKVLTLVHILGRKEEESMLPQVMRKPLNVTHALLGRMAGLRRETVTKQLHVLKDESLIASNGRKLYLTEQGRGRLME